jgi:hypothetical protein
MLTALFFAGLAVGLIRYAMKHESKPVGDAERLDNAVATQGLDQLPFDWADVYVNGERPLSQVQLREMLSYYR